MMIMITFINKSKTIYQKLTEIKGGPLDARAGWLI